MNKLRGVKMKKKWMLVLAGALVVSTLAACGKTEEKSKGLSNDNIAISQYKGVEVAKAVAEKVTEEDVEKEIQALLYANRVMNEVTDRGAKEGDIVKLDYTGVSNEEKFDEGSLEVEIGNSNLIEGFEEGLIDHKAGDSFDLNLTFPENYVVNPDLSGAPAVFHIKIKTITSQEIPELNDEFVKKVSEESSNVEEYRKQIEKELKELNKAEAKKRGVNAAWDAVLANTKVTKYPKKEVKEVQEMITSQYKMLAESNGIEFKDFLEKAMNGMTEEQFAKEVEKAAKDTVKQDMAAQLITEKEKLELSEKELDKVLEEYRTRYRFESIESMKEEIGEKYLMKDIQLVTVKKWVAENCKFVEEKKEAK